MSTNNRRAVTFAAPWPELMVEEELAAYLRLPAVSANAKPGNVIANLRRERDLPCLAISNRLVYPLELVREWVKEQAKKDESTTSKK